MAEGILTLDNIVLNAKPADRWEGIEMCGDIFVKNGYTIPEYVEYMKERERTASIYLGNHVAIPHGVVKSADVIKKSGICVVQTPEGVDFDGEKAYVFIGIAGKGDEHIEILGKIAMVCCDEDNVLKLRNAKTKEEIMEIMLGADA